MATATAQTDGRCQFMLALLLALGGWIGCVVLQVALYARPAPLGGPFLAEWQRYFWLANYYDLLGVWLLSLPFFGLWLALYRQPLSGRWRVVPALQAAILALNLFFSQIDHEILRFLGVRLNPSFVLAYGKPKVVGDTLFLDVLGSDRGGAWLSLVLLVVAPGLYLAWATRLQRRSMRLRAPLWLAILLALVPLAAPANGWRMATSQFRLRKVEPVVLAFAADLSAGYADLEKPADFAALAAGYRTAWLARSTDKAWRFPDPERPYLRVPTEPAPPAAGPKWNVLYIQLETMRGMDAGYLRPTVGPSPTPVLDRLAVAPDAMVWTRALSFGMPTINGIFATHCSVMPPSRRYVTALTHVAFHCLPEVLRRHGYRSEMFQAADTDWDNSTPWLRHWYDKLWRHPEAQRSDRRLYRIAARRIRALGRSGQPFFAGIVSVTNHTPFTSVEPGFDIAGQASAAERIRNTTHYADHALGELLDDLRTEPWFARTLVVIVGDHGFNVGEHGQVVGQHNLYRESLWVPLIIAGPHPRLKGDWRDTPASLLDLAPTLADLLGVREANPWQGHSLLAVNGGGTIAFGFRASLVAESLQYSAVLDPGDGEPRLFARADWLQEENLAARDRALGWQQLEPALRARRLHDYLLRQDKLWRPPLASAAAGPLR